MQLLEGKTRLLYDAVFLCYRFMVNSAGLCPKSRVSIALSANELAGNVLISFSKAEKCW